MRNALCPALPFPIMIKSYCRFSIVVSVVVGASFVTGDPGDDSRDVRHGSNNDVNSGGEMFFQ